MQQSRALRRSPRNRMIGGGVGGPAEFLDVDPALARVLYVVASIISAAFPGIFVYIICWLVIPEE